MIPQPNNHITIFFHNSLQLEGIVETWSDTISTLKSVAGSSTIVIQNTKKDVLAYKISNAKVDYEKVKQKTIKSDDDIRDIAALKIELNELEKQEIAERLSTHTADNIRQIQYGIPTTIKSIPIPQQHTNKEIRRESINVGSELSNLFQKRH